MRLPSLALLFFTATLARAEYSIRESFSETHPFDARGEITLSNANGAVTIRTWDRADVKIEGMKSAKTEEELKLIGLTIDASPSRLTLKTDFPRRSRSWFRGDHIRAEVRLTLTVPATVRLRQIDAVNGSVTIDGVHGPVTVRTVNGGVTAHGLSADTSLETVNGSIRAEFGPMTRDQQISARTVNGSATVALPSDASCELRARSVNGGVSCAFPIRLEGSTGRTRLGGTIGSGGATLKIDTVNGSIRVTQL